MPDIFVDSSTPGEKSSFFTADELRAAASRRLSDLKAGTASNVPDSICMDIPFLTRVMEECRESIKTDIDLHVLLEKIIFRSSGSEVLTMQDYSAMVPSETVPQAEDAETACWWTDMSDEAQRQYLKDHPGSSERVVRSDVQEALVKNWGKYDKLRLKSKLHVDTKAGRAIDLVKGDMIGLRLSSNGKLTRMITEKLGPTIVVTLEHSQADQIRKKCERV